MVAVPHAQVTVRVAPGDGGGFALCPCVRASAPPPLFCLPPLCAVPHQVRPPTPGPTVRPASPRPDGSRPALPPRPRSPSQVPDLRPPEFRGCRPPWS
ncbi:hypothetical protein FRAHR75_30115 [Frankia sp. Hr75.2]|nr:hypothetical protein FRAHR75_30115 [Frankia sp. Hr75.2]